MKEKSMKKMQQKHQKKTPYSKKVIKIYFNSLILIFTNHLKYGIEEETKSLKISKPRRKCRVINYLRDEDEAGSLINSNEKFYSIIDQILPTVRSLIMKNNHENPADIVKLQIMCKKENLWIPIMFRLINKIELNDPLGPAIISIFLEETPLPTKV